MLEAPTKVIAHLAPWHRSIIITVLVGDLLLGLILGLVLGTTIFSHRSSVQNARPSLPSGALLTTVTIPQNQDLFEPFILAVQPHTTVTWKNGDSLTHTFTTTPAQSNFLNQQSFSLKVPAHQSATFTFIQPGLYHYYDSTRATWNTVDDRVAANKGVPHYPEAMDGVIWVKGSIANLPTAATNRIPNGHDDFMTEFLAINPGSVSWHNFDTDPHSLALVPNLSIPSDPSQKGINPAEIGINPIAGTDDVPGGDTITVLFNKPGLYYYYCPNHAYIDARTLRAEALPKTSEYPISMEGFVLVVDS